MAAIFAFAISFWINFDSSKDRINWINNSEHTCNERAQRGCMQNSNESKIERNVRDLWIKVSEKEGEREKINWLDYIFQMYGFMGYLTPYYTVNEMQNKIEQHFDKSNAHVWWNILSNIVRPAQLKTNLELRYMNMLWQYVRCVSWTFAFMFSSI